MSDETCERRSGVLFDIDGTLVDSNYLHTIAWARGFADAGAWAPMHAIHRRVGMGGDQLVAALLGAPNDVAREGWRHHYEQLRGEAQPFPGASLLLRRVRRLGLAVVLATSAPGELLDHAIELLGVRGDVDAATSSADVDQAKPDPAVVEAALTAGNVDRERALFVGDSIWDVQAARRAGIGCIGLESGGFSRHELSEEGAIAVYRDAEELLDQVLTSPIAALR